MENSPEVIWKAIDEDDFVCEIGHYMLRVEQMDENYWWWAVYYKEEDIGFDDPAAKTEGEAKEFAEKCFREHWNELPF